MESFIKFKRNIYNQIQKEKMSGKSQAALEFLTTYGWAFLVILVMIGTLAYFGVLSPSKILPNRCTFGTEFQCIDYQISAAADTFRIKIKNSVGEPIDVSTMTISSESATSYSCTTPPTNPSAWKSGTIQDLIWSGCNSAAAGIVSGEKGKILIAIRYNTVSSGSTYTKEVKGEVFSGVI